MSGKKTLSSSVSRYTYRKSYEIRGSRRWKSSIATDPDIQIRFLLYTVMFSHWNAIRVIKLMLSRARCNRAECAGRFKDCARTRIDWRFDWKMHCYTCYAAKQWRRIKVVNRTVWFFMWWVITQRDVDKYRGYFVRIYLLETKLLSSSLFLLLLLLLLLLLVIIIIIVIVIT